MPLFQDEVLGGGDGLGEEVFCRAAGFFIVSFGDATADFLVLYQVFRTVLEMRRGVRPPAGRVTTPARSPCREDSAPLVETIRR
jgi:hypothetical protein